MDRCLEGRVVLVTEAGSGIGRADCGAIGISVDVTRAGSVQGMIGEALARYGRIDCAFDSAGVYEAGTIVETTEETWDTVINTNLKGVWLCMKIRDRTDACPGSWFRGQRLVCGWTGRK